MTLNRADRLQNAPLHDLLVILLRQYKRLLDTSGVTLSEADIRSIADHIIQHQPPDTREQTIRDALAQLVSESLDVLGRWNLTFEQALHTEMSAMPGWESTAEFLEVANEKGNAELRIASASVLVTALGDWRYVPHLFTVIAHNPDDLEALTARRVLLLVSGVDPEADDWLAQVRAWYAGKD